MCGERRIEPRFDIAAIQDILTIVQRPDGRPEGVHTPDLGGTAATAQVAQAVCEPIAGSRASRPTPPPGGHLMTTITHILHSRVLRRSVQRGAASPTRQDRRHRHGAPARCIVGRDNVLRRPQTGASGC
jgi:hypothetical protein